MIRAPHIFKLSLFGTCFALLVVALGAYTRLVDAGLGCPDWPGCYGQLTVPQTSQEIRMAELQFPDSPVEIGKGWAEMSHRYVAGVLGLIVLVICILSVRQRRKDHTHPIGLPVGLLVLVICQALFGMWTVTLKLWPQVVTLHLLGGFATLSLLFLLTLRSRPSQSFNFHLPVDECRSFRKAAMMGLCLLIFQITLGGWTSSNYAAYACSELPTCQGSWWPRMDFVQGFNLLQTIGPNYLGGTMDNEARVAIHMSHRIGGIIVLLYVGWLGCRIAGRKETKFHQLGWLLLITLGGQIVLGLSNVYWHLPLPIAVAHNAGGALLLLVLVAINYYLRTANSGDNHIG